MWWCETNKKNVWLNLPSTMIFVNLFFGTLCMFHLKKTSKPMYGHHFFSYTQKVWNNYLKCWAWWVNRVETICPLWRSTDLPILIANAEAKKKSRMHNTMTRIPSLCQRLGRGEFIWRDKKGSSFSDLWCF